MTLEMDQSEEESQNLKSEEDPENMETLSSSDDESQSDDDQEMQLKIQGLEAQVNENAYSYDSHVQLINTLRLDGDLDRLRKAREKMNEIFPLSPDLWLDWLKDETKIALCPDSRKNVEDLCNRAVKDYSSVDVWLEYCQFSIGDLSEPNGIIKIRNVFERAITSVGLHPNKGTLIWETYREFENAVLSTMQLSGDGSESEGSKSKIDEQINLISSIFKRQLSIPHLTLEQTFKEYSEWQEEELDENTKNKYKKAKTDMKNRNEFEEKLESSVSPHLAEYYAYLNYEEKQGDPARIQCLYERAIADNCLAPDLWLRYCSYMDKKLKISSISYPVHERSIRNCPWSSNLWIEYMLAYERYNRPFEDIKSLFDKGLVVGFTVADEYRMLWTTYLECLNRQVDWYGSRKESSIELLRTTFKRAQDYLSEYFPSDGDPYCSIQQYQARVEARHLKNIATAREIWADIMAKGNGKYAQMWIEYYGLERSFGDVDHERKVLQMGVQCASDSPESVVEALLQFEKDVGSVEQYDAAVKRCNAQMERVTERRTKAAEKEVEQSKQGRNLKRKINQEKPSRSDAYSSDASKKTNAPSPSKRMKRPPPPGFENQYDGKPIAKKSRPEERDKEISESKPRLVADDKRTVFLSNLSYTLFEQEIRDTFASVGTITDLRLVKDFRGNSKGYCYLEFETSNEVEAALKMDRHLIQNRPMFVSKCNSDKDQTTQNKFKYGMGLEKKKLFVKGLSFDTTKVDLEEYFKQFGALKEVRMVTYRSGNPKGLAFIEFEDESCSSGAVMKADGITLQGKQISVAISNPPERKNQPSSVDGPTHSLGSASTFGARGRGKTNLSMMPRALSAKSTLRSKIGSANDVEPSTSKMSNNDFRNMLLKK